MGASAIQRHRKTLMATITLEERNDLRARVLRGEELTLDQAKAVLETMRQGQAMLPVDKPKRKGKTQALSTDQLNADLAALGL